MSDLMRSTRYLSLTAALICWMTVCSKRLKKVEFTHILIILTNGVLNLILCCTVYLRRGYWMCCGAIKYCCRVDAGVGSCGCDESKVALVTSPGH